MGNLYIVEDRDMKYAMKNKTHKTSDARGWMALDDVTSHFFTMLEPISSASFLSSLSIIYVGFKQRPPAESHGQKY